MGRAIMMVNVNSKGIVVIMVLTILGVDMRITVVIKFSFEMMTITAIVTVVKSSHRRSNSNAGHRAPVRRLGHWRSSFVRLDF